MAEIPLLEQAETLNQQGKYSEAAELYDQVLTQNHDHPDLLATIGTLLLRNSKTIGLAIVCLERALARCKKPTCELYSNLGLAYKYAGLIDKAQNYMRLAVETDPTAGVLSNYGSYFVENANVRDGAKYLERAVKMDPALAMARWNLSLCLLALANESGEWGRAWDEYEYGQREGGLRVTKKNVPLPDWDGSPGKVVVYGEQGLGDEIMFASMLPDLMKTNEVILDCHPRLTTLFEKSFGVRCYGTRKNPELDWLDQERPDYMIAVGSLGKFFRREKEAFPGTPYLKADPLPRDAESQRKFRVGISWTGGRLAGRVAKRTIPLNWWRSILDVPNCEFVSMQYTDGSEIEVESVERLGYTIKQPPEAKAKDYYETAQLVKSCDLIITVTTSILHLAGALGVPCWVMVPHDPDWRSGVSGAMRWYRSVRLYRQPKKGQDAWIDVVQRVGLDLSDLMAADKRAAA